MVRISRKKEGGFTLIEILVVVAIIGILTAILVANFGAARQNSKNKTLRTALAETQLALEVYKAQHDSYPAALSALVPTYISGVITAADSANPSCVVSYNGSDGTRYKLTAANCVAGATSQATGIQTSDEFARCPSTCGGTGVCSPSSAAFYQSIAVYSAGGECL